MNSPGLDFSCKVPIPPDMEIPRSWNPVVWPFLLGLSMEWVKTGTISLSKKASRKGRPEGGNLRKNREVYQNP